MPAAFRRIPSYRSATEMSAAVAAMGAELPVLDPFDPGPLRQPLHLGPLRAANRLCVQPMEGWDAEPDGRPSTATIRRWRRFGASGAGLVWGGEAVAVRTDGRANPNQLCLRPETAAAIGGLLDELRAAHGADPVVGLQLTHSGRYSRPRRKDRPEPRVAYHHPLLDRRVGLGPDDAAAVSTDDELDGLIGDYAAAAALARELGFQFVDLKHCHGYLLHELLSARGRPGRFGGDFAGRTRFLRQAVAAIRREAPGLGVAVRLSAFDALPFRPGADGTGEPEPWSGAYPFAFGASAARPTEPDLEEPRRLLALLRDLGVIACNITGGSPYYNPHIQRPAQYPPSDGYLPPEDPVLGVARHVRVTAELRAAVPGLPLVGSGYSYLQEYLPHVAAATVARGLTDAVGLGRMILAYPEFVRDALEGRLPDRRRLCRTFSDCTSAPRLGLRSGCYPLDPDYRASPEGRQIQDWKRATAGSR